MAQEPTINPQNNEDTLRWPDLSPYGMRMVSVKLPTGDNRLLMVGGDAYPSRLLKIGFAKHGSLWLRKNTKITKNELATVFPNVRIVDMKRSDIYQALRKKEPTQSLQSNLNASSNFEIKKNRETLDQNEDLKSKIELESSILIGINHLGQDVYESVEGRYIKGDKSNITRESDANNALFLRGTTVEDLELCADSIINQINDGRFYRKDDINRFAEIVLGEDKDDPVRLRQMHDAISHALSRKMYESAADAGPISYNVAIKLHQGLPPLEAERAERVTPLPVGVIAQRMLIESEGKRFYTPVIGNGSMVSALENFSIITNENIDDSLSHLKSKSNIETTEGLPAHDISFMSLVANTVEEQLIHKGLKFDREDHHKIIESLSYRADKGRSVFLIKSDADALPFINTLASSYMIEGVVELDSSLFGKSDANHNRLMIVIGEIGSCQFNDDKIKKIFDYDALWSWSDNIVSENQKSTEVKLERDNSYQTPYIPSSKASDYTGMVPRNLAGPTREALANLEERHGNVDLFVAKELQLEVDDLGIYFDAGQVDAIGLAIDAFYRNRFFIEADQTGMGKGRVLAAMARFAILKGMKTVFVTEKGGLFGDFFRDIQDTGSFDLVKHKTINANLPIFLNGKKLFHATEKETIHAMLSSLQYPDDANLVMATYSQFSRKHDLLNIDPKVDWLHNIAEDSFLILDESHNAGGQSNTGDNLNRAIVQAKGCIFSSATFAKDPNNFYIYNRVMPPAITANSVPSVLKVGGDPLAEVFSAMLAADGVMIRREHDLSDLRFEMEVDYEHLDRNEMYANKLAEILEAFGVISGEIRDIVNKKNEKLLKSIIKDYEEGDDSKEDFIGGSQKTQLKLKNIGWRSVGVGSILYQSLRQFMMAVKTDKAVDIALTALREGRKPVIVVENTMESLLGAVIAQNNDLIDEDYANNDDLETDPNADVFTSDSIADIIQNNLETDSDVNNHLVAKQLGEGDELMVPMSFTDVLHKILDRLLVIKKIERGNVTEDEMINTKKMIRLKESLEMLINNFPHLDISPIDVIKTKIEQAGYTCGEISGRKTGVITTEEGVQVITKIKESSNKTKIIHQFNNGELDAVVLTTAGATGISLHSSRKFDDQRTRELIELQIPNNVATRVQTFGRVNRKDQRCPPIIRTLVSGLPSEIRLLSMQNIKLREMSANTTSNRDNSILNEDFPDLLNNVGGLIAMQFLSENIDVARRLCINEDTLSQDFWSRNKIYHANILTQRLGMLNIEDQRTIFDKISTEYNAAIEEMNVKGINPFKTSEMDIKATTIHEEVISSKTMDSGSVFDEPVLLRTVEYKQHFKEYNWEMASFDINKSKEVLKKQFDTYSDEGVVNGILSKVNAIKDDYISRALTSKYESVADALSDSVENPVKRAAQRIININRMVPLMMPGREISLTRHFSTVKGIITDFRLPRKGAEHMLSEYNVRVQVPGRGSLDVSMYSLLEDPNFDSRYTASYGLILDFGKQHHSSYTMTRKILTGNVFRAASWAQRAGEGTSVIYTDDKGERHRGVILPEAYKAVSFKTNIPINMDIAKQILLDPDKSYLLSTAEAPDKLAFTLRRKSKFENDFVLHSPAGKAAEPIFNNTKIPDLKNPITGKRGSYEKQSTIVDHYYLDQLLQEFKLAGFTFYADHSLEDKIKEMNEILLQEEAQQKEERKIKIVANL